MIHGTQSYRRLATCRTALQSLVLAAAEDYELMVLCGHRGEADQNKAFDTGKSKVRWPNGRHNSLPSRAVDLAPWPLDWEDLGRFDAMGRHVLEVAKRLQIPVIWGGNWKRFVDRPHFELVEGATGV